MDVEIGGGARGPLVGFRVVDFSNVVSGPLCRQIQAGRMRQLRNPVRFRDTALGLRHHPPRLGQHTDELLREAGFADEEIRSLREGGAVG
ncbi:MAG: hypothetical protein QNK03_27230 [Myxococcota bacterium]|nr:hypothetical protein [Myxococcota bacterium]